MINIRGRGIGAGIRGRLAGVGRGLGRGLGRGQQPEGFGLGPNGECVCPKCGTKVAHQRGTPCYEQKCPKCDALMTREN